MGEVLGNRCAYEPRKLHDVYEVFDEVVWGIARYDLGRSISVEPYCEGHVLVRRGDFLKVCGYPEALESALEILGAFEE